MKNFRLSRLIAGAMLTLALTVSLTSSTDAWQGRGTPGAGAPFTGIVAFGDSLTDTGNAYAFTYGAYPPEPYYSQGRFSNGKVWIEYLAKSMHLAPRFLENYAVGGAMTGDQNGSVPGLPGLEQQLQAFENGLGGKKADKRALYVVWIGANDLLLPLLDEELSLEEKFQQASNAVPTAIYNTIGAVQRLHDAGARRIMVVNLPDLGLTPSGNTTPLSSYYLTFLSNSYNAALESELSDLEDNGIETVRVDSAGILQKVVSDPPRFGFSNVVDQFLGTCFGDPSCDPSDYLFWDSVHPTTDGHRIIASGAMRVLREKFPHVWGTPRNRR